MSIQVPPGLAAGEGCGPGPELVCDILSHTMDLSRYLVGEPVEVSGLLKTFITERPLPDGTGRGKVDVDDSAQALVKFENGAVGYYEGSRFAPGRKNYNHLEINGSKGSLVWDLERMNELELYVESGPLRDFRRFRSRTKSIRTCRRGGHPVTSSATSIHSLTPSSTS
jgi:predicted dehydrogenase